MIDACRETKMFDGWITGANDQQAGYCHRRARGIGGLSAALALERAGHERHGFSKQQSPHVSRGRTIHPPTAQCPCSNAHLALLMHFEKIATKEPGSDAADVMGKPVLRAPLRGPATLSNPPR